MKIYYCNINEFIDLSGNEYLSPKRRERFERYHNIPAKKACLISGLLLQMVLGNDYENHITANSHGKPQFKDCSLFFNLSHSGDYVVLAVSDHEFGIDIEKIAPYNPNIIRKCFTAKEKEWLESQMSRISGTSSNDISINLPDKNNISNPINIYQPFYYLWTGKEAVMKATGLGFSMNPASFCLSPIQNGKHFIHEKTWYLMWDTLNHHQICIASENIIYAQWEFISREKLLTFFT